MDKTARLSPGQAADRMYNAYRGLLYRKALSLSGGNAEKAKDAVQQVFLRVLASGAAFESLDRFRTRHALMLTLRSVCCAERDRADSARLIFPGDEIPDPADPSPGTEEQVVAREGYERLLEFISELPENYRAVVELRLVEEFSYEDIGLALGTSADSARVYFSRARKMLAARLREEGY